MRARRRAMTLAEVLVALAIMAILAAILIPQVTGQIRKGQAAAIAEQLTNLRQAILNYRDNVKRFPHRLNQLTEPQPAGAPDICNVPLSASNAASWRGPYLAQPIVGNIPVGDATVQMVVVRVPATNAGGPIGTLQILVTDVDSLVAADLESQFDGAMNYSTGSILWAPVGGAPRGTLTFQMPVRDC